MVAAEGFPVQAPVLVPETRPGGSFTGDERVEAEGNVLTINPASGSLGQAGDGNSERGPTANVQRVGGERNSNEFSARLIRPNKPGALQARKGLSAG